MGLFDKLKSGLGKTRDGFSDKIGKALGRGRKVSEELFEELEEVLIEADLGIATSMAIVDKLRVEAKERKISDASGIKDLLLRELTAILDRGWRPLFRKGAASGHPLHRRQWRGQNHHHR